MIRIFRNAALAVVIASFAMTGNSKAQQPPLSVSQPDCQTILQCNFRRGGVFRGCISAYSCRRCRLVRARDCGSIGAGRSVCQRMQCSWG